MKGVKYSILLLMLFSVISLNGQLTRSWTGASTMDPTDWNDDDNWDSVAPGMNDYAFFNFGTSTVINFTGTSTIGRIRIRSGNTLNISGSLTIDGGVTPGIWCEGANLSNDGTIIINNINHAGIQMEGGNFDNEGTITISNTLQAGVILSSSSTFSNNDDVSVNSTTGGNGHGINIGFGCTYNNMGTSSFGNISSISGKGIVNSGTLTNISSITIDRCMGQGIQNVGMITSSGGISIGTDGLCNSFGIDNNGSFTNSGLVTIEDVNMNFDRLHGSSGTFTNDGTLHFIGENKSYGGTGMLINNETLKGTGSINVASANFTNNGTIAPGASPGQMTFINGYPGGIYEAEIPDPTSHDNIIVSGSAVLGGTLNVIGASASPTVGDEFEIITGDYGMTTFGTVNLPTPVVEWDIIYNTGTVTIKFLGPLPVTLSSFDAKTQSKYIAVDWVTESEVNNDGFMLERSIDGKRWTKLDWIRGNKTTHERNEYSYEDKSPFTGKNYYRLKQVDIDGKFVYSEVISANWKSKKNEIKIFPSPSVDFINMKNTEIIENLTVFNAQGQEVLNQSHPTGRLDVSSFVKGIYYIHMEVEGGEVVISKFVKE